MVSPLKRTVTSLTGTPALHLGNKRQQVCQQLAMPRRAKAVGPETKPLRAALYMLMLEGQHGTLGVELY